MTSIIAEGAWPERQGIEFPHGSGEVMRVLCADWALDTDTHQLVRSGDVVHVSPKAFDLLTTLLRERPRALSKVELRDQIWPHTFVSETSLANLIAELRSALGDEAGQPRYIRTVHRHGYAFCGSATNDAEAPPAGGTARVHLLVRDREIALTPGTYVLGREPEAAVWIDSTHVSRHHARIAVTATGASIEDLGSKNGTFVNRARVVGVQPLCDRDEIDLGPERLVVRVLAGAVSTRTQPR
jgi:DNA-binding winged helix-turn-helix (wHTH) protein